MVSSGCVVSVAKTIHRWVGAMLALLLILVSLTGILLVWKNVYVAAAFSEHSHAFVHSTEALGHIAESVEEYFGSEKIKRIEFGDATFGLSKVYLENGRAAYVAASGEVVQTWDLNERPEDWLLDLHHRLLSDTTGLYVVGFSGIATIALIFLGVIAFWPTRQSWRKGLRLNHLRRATLLRVHRNLGVVLAIPILLVVFAGVVLTFPELSRSAFFWPYQNDDSYGEDFGDGVDEMTGEDVAAWPQAISRAAAVFPDASITGLVWPAGTGVKQVLIRQKEEWAQQGSSSVHINEFDGYMELRINAQTLPLGEVMFNLMGPLHKSGLGGRLYDVLQSLVGLGLIYLGILGLMSFVKSTFSR